MHLLDKPFDRKKRESVNRELEGCVNRINVSDDVEEIVRLIGFACANIHMIAYSRVMSLLSKEDE